MEEVIPETWYCYPDSYPVLNSEIVNREESSVCRYRTSVLLSAIMKLWKSVMQ